MKLRELPGTVERVQGVACRQRDCDFEAIGHSALSAGRAHAATRGHVVRLTLTRSVDVQLVGATSDATR